MSLTGSSTGSAVVATADSGGDICAALPSPLPLSLTAVAATTPGTSIAHPYTVSTPSSLLPSPSSPGNNGGTNHPLHPQQLQLHQLQQQHQRHSYNRSLSSSPRGQAEAEGGGAGPIPVIEFPDDEVHFYPPPPPSASNVVRRFFSFFLSNQVVDPQPLPSSIREILPATKVLLQL